MAGCLARAAAVRKGFSVFVWALLFQTLFPEMKKRSCPHTWDKSESLCDTTQIDISCEMPARYTYHHTCPDG